MRDRDIRKAIGDDRPFACEYDLSSIFSERPTFLRCAFTKGTARTFLRLFQQDAMVKRLAKRTCCAKVQNIAVLAKAGFDINDERLIWL